MTKSSSAPSAGPGRIARVAGAAAVAAALLAGAGCGPDFDPYNRLNSFRVLGLRSDLPNPPAGQTATLSAIVYPAPVTPGPDPTLGYTWTWCPFPLPGGGGSGYPCLFTSEALSAMAMLPDGMLPPTNLGTEPTAAFLHGAAPEQLGAVCAMFGVDCHLGFPVQIELLVEKRDDGGAVVDSIKSVWTLRLPTPTTTANQNPIVSGLVAVVDGQEQPLTNELVTIPRNAATIVRAGLDAADIETYFDPDPDGDAQTADGRDAPERLFLSWFVESGNTEDERTGTNYGDGYLIPVPQALELARANEWTPAKADDFPAETAQIFVIIRDNRGGVSSVSATVRLGGAP